jgi:hypothetical protein
MRDVEKDCHERAFQKKLQRSKLVYRTTVCLTYIVEDYKQEILSRISTYKHEILLYVQEFHYALYIRTS